MRGADTKGEDHLSGSYARKDLFLNTRTIDRISVGPTIEGVLLC